MNDEPTQSASESNVSQLKGELDELIVKGELLLIAMVVDLKRVAPADKHAIQKLKLPLFKVEYEAWYSTAMQVVKQLIPDRLADFVKQYKDEKRKEINVATYGISDYLIGIQTSYYDKLVADGNAAFPKFERQLSILKSARARFKSRLFDMVEVVQADLFDSELESAGELNRMGFARAAGAVAGVVLERHLRRITTKRNLKSKKSAPTINDLNQLLKAMRSILQHGDLSSTSATCAICVITTKVTILPRIRSVTSSLAYPRWLRRFSDLLPTRRGRNHGQNEKCAEDSREGYWLEFDSQR